MKIYYILIVIMAFLLLFASCAVVEPEDCALCTAEIRSAGLLNLQTGEMFIIEITGRGDTMTLINTAGLTGWMSGELHISLDEGREINKAIFCESCRKELKNAGEYTHALISPEKEVLTLVPGARYEEEEFVLAFIAGELTVKHI